MQRAGIEVLGGRITYATRKVEQLCVAAAAREKDNAALQLQLQHGAKKQQYIDFLKVGMLTELLRQLRCNSALVCALKVSSNERAPQAVAAPQLFSQDLMHSFDELI